MTADESTGTDTLTLLRVVSVAVSSDTDSECQSNVMTWQCSEQGEQLCRPRSLVPRRRTAVVVYS